MYDIYGNLIFEKNQNITDLEIPDSNPYITVLPFGKYCLLDTSDQEKYCFEINYKDQYTPLVDYFLNIDKKHNQIDENDDKKDDQVDDKKDDRVDEKEDNEKDNQLNEKNDEDKSQNIKENPKNDDNKMGEVSDNTKESTIDKNNTDQDIEKVLPNTYNYIGVVKLILVIVLIANIVILQIPKHD